MKEIIKTEHLAYTYPGVDDTPGVSVFEDMNLMVEEGVVNPPWPSILTPFCCLPAARSMYAALTPPLRIGS